VIEAMIRRYFPVFLFLAAAQAQDKVDIKLPDGAGKDVVIKTCDPCHGLGPVVDTHLSKAGWRKKVDKMIDRGAEGTDEEFDAIVTYLAAHYGEDTAVTKIYVNSATAKQLETGLGLSPSAAAAIVKQRTKTGRFKDWRDVAKVSGVDAKVIETKKDQLIF